MLAMAAKQRNLLNLEPLLPYYWLQLTLAMAVKMLAMAAKMLATAGKINSTCYIN